MPATDEGGGESEMTHTALTAAADALTLTIRVKRELFRFDSKQQWINKGKSWYANCGVQRGFYITIDAAGHVVHMGQCFMAAEERGLYVMAQHPRKSAVCFVDDFGDLM